MAPTPNRVRLTTRRVVRAALALGGLGAILLLAHSPGAAQVGDALSFSTSYTITGNYAVGSVDLAPASGQGGFVTGTIPMSGVPANADIVAAFLLWETISSEPAQLAGAQFRGSPITVVKASAQALTPAFAPCWSSGGGPYTMTMFRASVRHLLPRQLDANGDPVGKPLVNSADLLKYGFPLHQVTLPEAGTGNQVPQSAGATLLVVYRNPDPVEPLRKIVLYDGIHVQAPGARMTQAIRGVLESSGSDAKMTHVVGSGAKNSTERVWFNNNRGLNLLLETNPFEASAAASSDRGWSTRTFVPDAVHPNALPGYDFGGGYGEEVSTVVDHDNTSPYDCLSWAAIIFSAAVPDTDGDGLPDKLESVSGLKEPDGEHLPDLPALGASATRKDVFLEIGAMSAGPGTSYGSLDAPFSATTPTVVDPVGHTHLPTPAVLKMVGDALKNAPVGNPDGSTGITLHADVGSDYHALGDAYVSTDADAYLVPAALARGGESILEVPCVENPEATPPVVCQFPAYPGTVGWKVGFQLYRDTWVGDAGEELDSAGVQACKALALDGDPGTICRRRFDGARKDIFHYGLYAHARGVPKSTDQCLDTTPPGLPDASGACEGSGTVNPDFRVPKGTSGRGDGPGGDFIVSLGFFDNFVGTDFVQASTTMHELGHNFDLWHGGAPPQFSEVGGAPSVRVNVSFAPNCKPNYLSVMSYLFQIRGLVDADGVPHVNYSGAVNAPIDETNLGSGVTLPGPYRTGWYAPRVPGTLGYILGTPAAKRYCDGSSFLDPLPEGWPEGGFARIDATGVSTPIDWNGDGTPLEPSPQDVNFDRVLNGTPSLQGFDDWANLRLNQVGSRANIASVASLRGLLAGGYLDGGYLDGGYLDGGYLDGGYLDGGYLDGGYLDGGYLDGGYLDGGYLDGGYLDGGYLDGGYLDGGYLDGDVEVDVLTVKALGNAPPNAFTATVVGIDDACSGLSPAECHRIRLRWTPQNAGTASLYRVYRVEGASVTEDSTPVLVGEVPAVPGQTEYVLVDGTEHANGIQITYWVVAQFDDLTMSGPSNFATITAVNVAPVADADEYPVNQDTSLVVAAPGVLEGDTDVDSAFLSAVLETAPLHGALTLGADGSFTYTPAPGFAGTDSFTYWAKDASPISAANIPATVTITVVDATPPLVNLSLPAPNGLNGFFTTSPVIVGVRATDASRVTSFTCLDNGASIAVTGQAGAGTVEATGSLVLAAEGIHNLSCIATDGAPTSNSGAAAGSSNTGTVKIDTQPPVVTITTPPTDAVYLLNAAVNSNYGCQDPAPGSGVTSCVGPVASGSGLATSTAGPKTFTVTATDAAGHVTVKTHNYAVQYLISVTPLKSPAQQGSAVSVVWALRDGLGNSVSSLSTLLKMESVFNGPAPAGGCVPSAAGIKETLFSQPSGATGNSSFRFIESSDSYKFNWDTTTSTTVPIQTGKGCYTVLIYLDDQSPARMTTPVLLR